MRNSLVKSDSWVELFEQLARIAVKSTYFASGRGAALAVLEDFRAGYAERHGGSSEVLAVLEATIARMDGRLGEVGLLTSELGLDRLQSPIARVLLGELQPLASASTSEPPAETGPRGAIVTALRAAAGEKGNQRRRLVEQAFWLAARESHSAPFIEHRDVLSGIGTGIMAACLDEVMPYISQRKQFGQPVGNFQLMQGKIADMYTKMNSCRAYVYAVARACDLGQVTRQDAAACVLLASEEAMVVAHQAVQALGGAGFMNDSAVSRIFRDAKLMEIGAGTSEIRRMLIGREMMGSMA